MSEQYQTTNDGPEFMTVEQARQELRHNVANFVPTDSHDQGFGFHEMTQNVLMDPIALQVYVDTYNKIIEKAWKEGLEMDREMVEQWVAEGGADPSD
jgi:hypothetical protein